MQVGIEPVEKSSRSAGLSSSRTACLLVSTGGEEELFVNSDEGGEGSCPIAGQERESFIDRWTLPPPGASNPTAQFFDALYMLASVIVALPAYLAMSLALALACYVRCAGVLLAKAD